MLLLLLCSATAVVDVLPGLNRLASLFTRASLGAGGGDNIVGKIHRRFSFVLHLCLSSCFYVVLYVIPSFAMERSYSM